MTIEYKIQDRWKGCNYIPKRYTSIRDRKKKLFRKKNYTEKIKKRMKSERKKFLSTRMGFEPTRAEHIGLAVQRLNHSATSSVRYFEEKFK